MAVVTSGATLAETLDNGTNLLSLEVADGFGNTNTRFYGGPDDDDGDDCDDEPANTPYCVGVSPGDIEDDEDAGGVPAEYKFGVDHGNPTIEQDEAAACGNLLQGQAIGVDGDCVATQYADDRSGFDVNPIRTRIFREAVGLSNSQEAACAVGAWDDDDGCVITGTTGSFDFFADPYERGSLTEAYYNVDELRARDAAYNVSPDLTFRVIRDITAPVIFGVAHDGSLTSGGQETVSGGVFDNLDVNNAETYMVWDGQNLAIRQAITNIGQFGPPFQQNQTVQQAVTFVGSMQAGSAGAPMYTSNFAFRVTDQARNDTYTMSPPFGGPFGTFTARDFNDPAGRTGFYEASETFTTTEPELCWDTDSDGCGTQPSSGTIRFSVTGDGSDADGGGPLPNPFTRVVLLVNVDSDNDGTTIDSEGTGDVLWTSVGNPGAVSVTESAGGLDRTYAWSFSVTGAQLAQAAGRTTITDLAADPSNDIRIRVVGYAADGAAFTIADGSVLLINLTRD
jgi:hypothetical protein